jgi:hypothetical protein
MEKELAEKLIEMLEDDGCEVTLRENYSGRGMYRKSTTGVVCDCDISHILALVISSAYEFVDEDGGGEPLFNVRRLRSDSMGMSTIIY